MESGHRQADTSLIARFIAERKGISFFQAVRLVEQYLVNSSGDPVAEPGNLGPIEQEPVLFTANPSLAFPIRDVAEVETHERGKDGLPQTHFAVNFMGVYGPMSPLAAYFTEDIIHGGREESNIKRFMDIFNHRMISFIYRSWTKYRYHVQYQSGGIDVFSNRILSLIGVVGRETNRGQWVEWHKLLPFISLLSMRNHPAWALERVLSSYMDDAPVTIRQFVLNRAQVSEDQQNRLGLGACALGEDLVLGESVPDLNGKIVVRIGPLSYESFRRLLPFGDRYQTLRLLILFALTDPLQFDIELVLDGDQIPKAELNSDAPVQLGCNCWLGEVKKETATVTQKGLSIYRL